jgi:hypothetical protein
VGVKVARRGHKLRANRKEACGAQKQTYWRAMIAVSKVDCYTLRGFR